jgi:origin recognition complex subunit 5
MLSAGGVLSIAHFAHFQDHIQKQFERKCPTVTITSNTIKNAASDETKLLTRKADLELPYYAKFLLISAYLASFNPQKSDYRFFTLNGGKMSKRGKSAHKRKQLKREDMTTITGPKAFLRERWINIFDSIMRNTMVSKKQKFCGFELQTMVNNLVSMELVLALKSKSDIVCSIPEKFIVNVNVDLVSSISQTVQFDLNSYMYDLVTK